MKEASVCSVVAGTLKVMVVLVDFETRAPAGTPGPATPNPAAMDPSWGTDAKLRIALLFFDRPESVALGLNAENREVSIPIE